MTYERDLAHRLGEFIITAGNTIAEPERGAEDIDFEMRKAHDEIRQTGSALWAESSLKMLHNGVDAIRAMITMTNPPKVDTTPPAASVVYCAIEFIVAVDEYMSGTDTGPKLRNLTDALTGAIEQHGTDLYDPASRQQAIEAARHIRDRLATAPAFDPTDPLAPPTTPPKPDITTVDPADVDFWNKTLLKHLVFNPDVVDDGGAVDVARAALHLLDAGEINHTDFRALISLIQ
jgi:hypothetical protein